VNNIPQSPATLLGEIEGEQPGWSLPRIGRHVCYWLFWMLLFATINSSNGNIGFWRCMTIECTIMLIKLPYTYVMIYILVPRFLLRKKYFPFAVSVFLMTLVAGTIVWHYYLSYVPELIENTKPARFLSSGYFYKTIDLLYVATFPTIFKLYQFYLRQEVKNRSINEKRLQAELEVLKHQLQPHFLFNTLNNLYGMVLTGDKNSANAILRLSSIIRYMLYECNEPFIPIEKEIELLKNYIELEKMRYGGRLDISFEIGGEAGGKAIAPLLLIGFVENAFKHGPGQKADGGWIRINFFLSHHEVDFLVENNLSGAIGHARIGLEPEHLTPRIEAGIGLENIKKRLDLQYGGKYQLKIESKDTFLIHLKLNL
jgi:two-component system, LytTR family, sensor kinase